MRSKSGGLAQPVLSLNELSSRWCSHNQLKEPAVSGRPQSQGLSRAARCSCLGAAREARHKRWGNGGRYCGIVDTPVWQHPLQSSTACTSGHPSNDLASAGISCTRRVISLTHRGHVTPHTQAPAPAACVQQLGFELLREME